MHSDKATAARLTTLRGEGRAKLINFDASVFGTLDLAVRFAMKPWSDIQLRRFRSRGVTFFNCTVSDPGLESRGLTSWPHLLLLFSLSMSIILKCNLHFTLFISNSLTSLFLISALPVSVSVSLARCVLSAIPTQKNPQKHKKRGRNSRCRQ
ncbi:hypothetical protein HDV63DRAFT_179079 [Trichoderma sp. SZMC 28014]